MFYKAFDLPYSYTCDIVHWVKQCSWMFSPLKQH